MLTAERLRQVVHYNPETGDFTRLISSKQSKAGDSPGYLHQHGYRLIGIDGRKYAAHRLAWLYVHGAWPIGDIDHIDRNRQNNALANLRDVDHASNCRNRSPIPGSSSKYVGVAWRKDCQRWTAQIRVSGKNYHLGYFDCEEDARDAYLAAKPKFHPIVNSRGARAMSVAA